MDLCRLSCKGICQSVVELHFKEIKDANLVIRENTPKICIAGIKEGF